MITTKFGHTDDIDVVNRKYLDTNLSKKEGEISYIAKDYNELNFKNNN